MMHYRKTLFETWKKEKSSVLRDKRLDSAFEIGFNAAWVIVHDEKASEITDKNTRIAELEAEVERLRVELLKALEKIHGDSHDA